MPVKAHFPYEALRVFMLRGQWYLSTGEGEGETLNVMLCFQEALEWAMKNHLWGHALFLSSKMDARTYNWVMSG